MTDLHYLTFSAVLTWVMLVTASLLRSRGWTLPGMRVAFRNRDDLPPPSAAAGRADRAARNMVENLVLFSALLAARLSGAQADSLSTGAAVFFWARVAYFPTYLAGIPDLRTLLWMVSLVGLGLVGFGT